MRRVTRKSISGAAEEASVPVGNFSTRFSLPSFVKRVEKLTDGQRNAIKKTGFGNLLLLPSQMLSKNLLAELMDRWSCEKRAFILHPGPIGITLTDVALILGLPVVGVPANLTEDECLSDLELEFGAVLGKRKIEISFLENKLDSLPDSVDDDFVRAFLLFTFGTLLFPNATGKIDSRYVRLLDNLDAVSSFAWGAAVLEDVVLWLNKRKETNVQYIGGCLIFLQIWSYEHIDIARPSLLDTYMAFPRACRWENSRSHQRQWFSTKFKELQYHQIIWTLQPTSVELKLSIVKELFVAENGAQQLRGNECPSQETLSFDMVGVDLVMDFQNKMGEIYDFNVMQAGESTSCSGVEVNESHVEPALTCEHACLTSNNEPDNSIMHCNVSGEHSTKLHKENEELRRENMLLREQLEQLRYECSSIKSEVEDLRRENLSLSSSTNNLIGRLENILLDYDGNTVEESKIYHHGDNLFA